MKRALPDVEHTFNNEPAGKALKGFKTVEISGDGDAAVLDIILLDALITATVEILIRSLLRKDGDGTPKSVVANCHFF